MKYKEKMLNYKKWYAEGSFRRTSADLRILLGYYELDCVIKTHEDWLTVRRVND